MKILPGLFSCCLMFFALTLSAQWTGEQLPVRYIVQEGDSLPGLAKLFDVTVNDLMKWNKLTSKVIKKGQELIVSAKRPAKKVDGFIFWRVPIEKKSKDIMEEKIEESFEEQDEIPVVSEDKIKEPLPPVSEPLTKDSFKVAKPDTLAVKEDIVEPSKPDATSDFIPRPLKIDTMPLPSKAILSDANIYLEADLVNDTASEAVMLVKIFEEGDSLPALRKEIYIQRIFFERVDTSKALAPIVGPGKIEPDITAVETEETPAEPTLALDEPEEEPSKKKGEAVESVDTVFVRQGPKRVFYDTIPYHPDTLIAPRLLFCGGVEMGIPVGISDLFLKNVGKEYIYAFYEQNKPIQTRQIMVELYEKNDADELLLFDERKYEIRPRWKHTYFKCRFPQPGEYMLVLYDENKKLMGKASVTIRNY